MGVMSRPILYSYFKVLSFKQGRDFNKIEQKIDHLNIMIQGLSNKNNTKNSHEPN